MICTNCKRTIEDGQFYQGRGWQAQHIECPPVEPLLTQVDYLPLDAHTGVVEINEPTFDTNVAKQVARRTLNTTIQVAAHVRESRRAKKLLRGGLRSGGFYIHGDLFTEPETERARRAGKRG